MTHTRQDILQRMPRALKLFALELADDPSADDTALTTRMAQAYVAGNVRVQVMTAAQYIPRATQHLSRLCGLGRTGLQRWAGGGTTGHQRLWRRYAQYRAAISQRYWNRNAASDGATRRRSNRWRNRPEIHPVSRHRQRQRQRDFPVYVSPPSAQAQFSACSTSSTNRNC